jgi:hypothetical protein
MLCPVLLVQSLHHPTERMEPCEPDQVVAHHSNRPTHSIHAWIKKQNKSKKALDHIATPQINPRPIDPLPPRNSGNDFGRFCHRRNSTPPPPRFGSTLMAPHLHPPPSRSTLIVATRGAEGRIGTNQVSGGSEKLINRRRHATSLPG